MQVCRLYCRRWLSSSIPRPPRPPPRRSLSKPTSGGSSGDDSKLSGGLPASRYGSVKDSKVLNAQIRRKTGGSRPFLILGAIGITFFGMSKLSEYRNNVQKTFEHGYDTNSEEKTKSSSWFGGLFTRNGDEPGESHVARKYLEELAEKGDESAQRVLQATKSFDLPEESVKFDEKSFETDFRIDIAPEGLLRTLRVMLERKRMEERVTMDSIAKRGDRFPRKSERELLLLLKKEKKEIKDLIKPLEKRIRQRQSV